MLLIIEDLRAPTEEKARKSKKSIMIFLKNKQTSFMNTLRY